MMSPATAHDPWRDQLRRAAAGLRVGSTRNHALLETLLKDQQRLEALPDEELKELILVVKHHRPDLALRLLALVRSPTLRHSLGNCLAMLWSRKDINSAWNAISSSGLPAKERLVLQSVMI